MKFLHLMVMAHTEMNNHGRSVLIFEDVEDARFCFCYDVSLYLAFILYLKNL